MSRLLDVSRRDGTRLQIDVRPSGSVMLAREALDPATGKRRRDAYVFVDAHELDAVIDALEQALRARRGGR